jgi:hypothetical protein
MKSGALSIFHPGMSLFRICYGCLREEGTSVM